MLNKKIVVLGAGVSGLSTATFLLKQEKDIKVHIIANIFPNDPEASSNEYTSTVAGAHWRSHAENNIRQQGFDKSTYIYLWKLAEQTTSDITGVMIIDEFEYWEKLPNDFVEPWYSTLCHGYRHLKKDELPDGVDFGITYKSSGTTERANKTDINDCIKEDTDIVINCSGLYSSKLGGVKDENLYPVRGQSVTVKLSQSCLKWACFRRGYNGNPKTVTYIIPRENGNVIFGGTLEENNHSTKIDYDVAGEIIQRCLATRPDILPRDKTELTIVGHRAGLRPCRKDGVRIEAEWIDCKQYNKQVLICHNYGHGGSGYESSYGTAQEAIEVIKEKLKN
ncbi:16536_t:CDS:10 [Cetraspora pellucida]|uniref:16536_t:CDS:1 n=1 Tax=Cetraspora pellucida TaxID=1433469 RepID=A0A9N9HK31_9GLOM|nr:16536_t:CDS:10 [Cetraspora pellucida]